MIACDTSYPPGEGYPEFCTLLSRFCAPLGGAEEVVNVPEPFWKTPDASGSGAIFWWPLILTVSLCLMRQK